MLIDISKNDNGATVSSSCGKCKRSFTSIPMYVMRVKIAHSTGEITSYLCADCVKLELDQTSACLKLYTKLAPSITESEEEDADVNVFESEDIET